MKPLRPPPSFFLRPPSGGLASAALPPPSDLQSGGRGLRFLSLSQSSSRSSLRLSHPLSSFLLSAPPGEVVWEETDSMGFLSTLLGVVGFGAGLPLGLVLGYFIFIYSEPSDVQVRFSRLAPVATACISVFIVVVFHSGINPLLSSTNRGDRVRCMRCVLSCRCFWLVVSPVSRLPGLGHKFSSGSPPGVVNGGPYLKVICRCPHLHDLCSNLDAGRRFSYARECLFQ